MSTTAHLHQNSGVTSVEKVTSLQQPGLLKWALAEAWQSKQFSDVQVVCGQDGGILQAHRIILASLSPLLRVALTSVDHDECVVLLPDADSSSLGHLLANVYTGDESEAAIDASLEYLQLTHDAFYTNQAKLDPSVPAQVLTDEVNEEVNLTSAHSVTEVDLLLDNEDDPLIQHSTAKKRKNRSFVWRFFERIDASLSSCKTCQFPVKTDKGNTSGMAGHLRTTHPDQYSQLKRLRETNEAALGEIDSLSKDPGYVVPAAGSIEVWDKPRRKKRSLVWKYFEQQDSTSALCITCSAFIKTEMGNTTGMANHLRGSHPELYQELQQCRGERTKRQCYLSSDGEEMADEAYQRHQVWQFFEPLPDSDHGSCTKCRAVLKLSLLAMMRHMKHQHGYSDLKSCVNENSTGICFDLAEENHPIWQFFDVSAGSDGMIQCLECRQDVVTPSMSLEPLEDHLEEHHAPLLISYRSLIQAESVPKKKAASRMTRSAVWNYFEKTDDKTKNVCMACGKILVCNQQNTTNMIRHLECNHHNLFIQFLKDSGSSEQDSVDALEGSSDEKSRRKRGPKPSFSDDPSHRTCPDCNKVYSCRPAMLYHRKTVHSGIRPYKCDECGMTFSRPDSYRGHTHSKVRSYLCSHCGKTFARKNIRDQHERAHRGDKRYPCSFCGKMFMTNQQRSNHERTHTGEKPFQCNECGRQFAQQHQLTTHMRIHTGEKPYSCDHCAQKFRHLSSRNNHKCENRVGRWTDPDPDAEQQQVPQQSI